MEKTMLITGASSDLGMAYLAKYGMTYTRIIAQYRKKNKQLDELLETYKDKIIPIQADLSKKEDVASFVETIKSGGDMPTHMIHLASLPAKSVRFHKSGTDMYQDMMQVSVYSVIEILRAVLEPMSKQKYGRILFLLSAYTTIPDPKYAAPYVVSKYALLGLMKSIAAEYIARGITANGISPQMIETKFIQDIPELIIEQHKMASPSGRILQKEDVLPMMQFLMSDDAASITGENISITGGNYIL